MDFSPEAAAAAGIEPEYIDIWGIKHRTSERVARAILASMPAREPEGSLPPALVVREDAESIRLRIPASRTGDSIKLEIRWENGDLEHHWFWLPELRLIEARADVQVKALPLPKTLRLGYHDLRVYWVEKPELVPFADSRLIVCPPHALSSEGRSTGVALSLYGLRSRRNWGVGDFTDLREVITVLAPAGVQFIALNPLHAIANRLPFNASPYLPLCAWYRNFLYLDVERVGEFCISPEMRSEIEALRAAEFVEYERAARLKLRVLKLLFRRFLASGGAPDFDQWAEAEGDLLNDYAVFCALDEAMHRRDRNIWLWTEWPEPYRDPRSEETRKFARSHWRSVLFYKWVQWQIDRELAETQAYARKQGMRIGLYHDLALATDRYGCDLWANRRFYVSGARVGSPPDDFSPKGQDWAFPPPNRQAHRDDGYRLFSALVRKNARHGGALRLDHVMRLFHLYWIPEGFDATEGAYVQNDANDLLGILALESIRGDFVVVGEDLGTVTEEVRKSLTAAGVLSYRVLWFEKNPDGSFRSPSEFPEHAAVSTTTHDLPTLAGFRGSRDIDARREAGLIDDAQYHQQMSVREREKRHLADALEKAGFADDPIGFVLATPSEFAIVNQEDLTRETEQQNLPGSTWQYPNWRRKMKVPVEEMASFAEELRKKIERAGRSTP